MERETIHIVSIPEVFLIGILYELESLFIKRPQSNSTFEFVLDETSDRFLILLASRTLKFVAVSPVPSVRFS